MNKYPTRPVGDTFTYVSEDGKVVELSVVDNTDGKPCKSCYFDSKSATCERDKELTGVCYGHFREDGINVIFKEEK